jgi:uncharacterized protein YcbK (DUF882 family)
MSILNRREFLKWSLAGAALVSLPARARSESPAERRLRLYNTHTGERLTATYWAAGQYQPDEIAALDRLLRDHRSGEVQALDRRLFDILHALQQQTGAHGTYEVISGYRSPATNNQLRRTSGGVAKDSLHTRGQAIDVRLTGVALPDLRRAALDLRAGGVGYYPASDFIHLDTGRVRTW